MREITYTVPQEYDGAQAQTLLKALGVSRRTLISLKRSGGITRNGAILRTVDEIHTGEEITLRLNGGESSVAQNPELAAEVLYENEDVVVFNKPPYMPVHPSQRHHNDTLANLFAARYSGLPFRPINRLDRNTSGLCVCAKNRLAAASLAGSLTKVYYAITDGTPPGDTIDLPIGRQGESVIKRCVTSSGKPAVTHFQRVSGERRSLLRITLETGRTHQIRVHMAHIGFPLCGDDMYGGDCSGISRQALHCGEVGFNLPVTREYVTVSAPLPGDMAALLDK